MKIAKINYKFLDQRQISLKLLERQQWLHLTWTHRHISNIDCFMGRTACLVCFISSVNGRSQKTKNKKKKLPWKTSARSRHITNLKQSILTLDIYAWAPWAMHANRASPICVFLPKVAKASKDTVTGVGIFTIKPLRLYMWALEQYGNFSYLLFIPVPDSLLKLDVYDQQTYYVLSALHRYPHKRLLMDSHSHSEWMQIFL